MSPTPEVSVTCGARAALRRTTMLALAAVLLLPLDGAAKEQCKVRASLAGTGVEAAARGTAKVSFKPGRSQLDVKIKDVARSASYTVVVGGVPRGTIATNRSGSGKLKLRNPPNSRTPLLDFDPRGKTLAVSNGTADVLAVMFSGAGEPSDIRVDERTDLSPTALAAGGKAEARFRMKNGRSTFKVEIEDVPAGGYDLYVDGILRGSITVGARGEGKIEFDSEPSPPKQLLDFDPRDKTIDVLRGTDLYFTGTMSAQIPGVNACEVTASELALTSTGADPDASARARFEIDDDCEREFDVQVEDLPVGDYELLVDGLVRGTIGVVATVGGTRGEIEFDTDPDDPGELLLTFEPRGALIEIRQGATTFFSAVFTGGAPPPAICTVVETEVPLLNSGAVAAAKGKARFRQDGDCDRDFRVEVEDLPVGDYTLKVGGTARGTITVANVGGEVEGRIAFDTDPDEPGELLLDFDPRGQLVEVVQGATLFLSRTFPD